MKLFERTKREVRLTEAGKRIVDEAQVVLGNVDHLLNVASRAGEGAIGHLSIGAPAGINHFMVEPLRVFGQRYPGVRVELQFMSTGQQMEAVTGHVPERRIQPQRRT